MTLTFPLSLPASPGFTDSAMSAPVVAGRSVSPFTGAAQVQLHDGEWWTLTLTLPRMTEASLRPWRALAMALRGGYGTVLAGDPDYAGAAGAAVDYSGAVLDLDFTAGDYAFGGSGLETVVVDGAGQTGRTLAVRGLPPDLAGALEAGTRFQLGSGSTARLHEILADADSDDAGEATLDIFPKLRSAPGDGDALAFTSPQGVFRLAEGAVPGWSGDRTKTQAPFTLQLVEAL